MADDIEIAPPALGSGLALANEGETKQEAAAIQKSMEQKKKLALSKIVLERSTQMLSTIYQLIKTAQIHDLGNVAFQTPLEGFCKDINSMPGENEFHVTFSEDVVYVNENRLRTDLTNFLSIKNLGKELSVRAMGGLIFYKGITVPELKAFIQAFVTLDQKLDSPIDALREQLEKAGLSHVQAEGIRKESEVEKVQVNKANRSKVAMKTYFHAIASYKAIMRNIQSEKSGDARKAKKIVQSLVDLCADEPSAFLGLSTIKDFDEYTYNHSVNVCILSIAFGQKLGLDKRQLCDLGAAALFHDIGKTDIPREVLNKVGKFSDQEWALMQSHPVLGVKAILRMKGFGESTIYRILVAFQHHIGIDGSGYPNRRNPKPLHFYTKIVSICDTFDAMTTSRVYQKAMRPDEALRLMSKTVAKRYDPLLLKAFVNTIGIFPPGTLVLLNTREIAVVSESHDDAALIRQPKVKVAIGLDGQILSQPRAIDLSEKRPDGSFKVTIVKSLDPKDYNLNIPHYVLTT